MKNFALLICSFFTVISIGCVSQPVVSSRPAVVWTRDAATEQEKNEVKQKVLAVLKDPESARFGEIWALNGSNGGRGVCGFVNAKNSYGGYTGNKTFMLMPDGSSVKIEGSGIIERMVPKMCAPRTVQ